MPKEKKLPLRLYLQRENAGTKEEYLDIHQSLDQIATIGETRLVGVYILKETLKITAKTQIVGGKQED